MITADARRAADAIAAATGVSRHHVAVVLGSGWAGGIEGVGAVRAELVTSDLPGFAPPAVEGHAGVVRSLSVDGVDVLAFIGRTHLYEHRDPVAVVHAVRTAAAAGALGRRADQRLWRGQRAISRPARSCSSPTTST